MKNKITLLALLFISSLSFSQTTYTWGSSSASGNWNTASNWGGGVAPAGGDIIDFNNNAQTSMTNDLTAANRYRIFFLSGATSARTIGGSTLNTFYDWGGANPKIENQSSGTHTLNFPIEVGSGKTLEINPVNGNLTFGGTVVNNSGNNILVWGNNAKILTFNGIFSGSSGLTLKQNSKVIYTASNTYSGATTLTGGTLELQASLANSAITVQTGATLTINASNVVVSALTVDSGGTVEILTGKGLTISGNLVNNGTMTIASDASTSGSLIVSGTSSGNITYNRYITSASSTKWHMIAAPVGGQSINTFATTGSNNIATSGVNYSITPYDNTVAKGATGTWNHWTSDNTGAGNISGAGNFIAGKGYEILTSADGTVAFTGTVPTAQVSIGITKPVSNNAWNLIGNPFPSSIPSNSNADTNNNFITVNASAMDPSYQAIYLWNPTTSGYDMINQVISATYIAPGQGFFVKAKTGGGTVNFATAMRTNQSTVAFQRPATQPIPSVTLKADDGTTAKTTDIKYIAGKTLGLDPGYDAGLFDATGGNFKLYTHLVADNGVNFMLQVLPDNVYDTAIIPVGLDAADGTQITFKADAQNLPVGKKVYLEDRLLNTLTEINNTGKTYQVTLNTQSVGIGRFYLHTQDNQSTLATQEFNILGLSVIARPKNNSIRILGNINGTTKVAIYDMLGRNIFSTEYKASNDNELSIPSMTQGIYIVKVESEKGNYSTKIAWY